MQGLLIGDGRPSGRGGRIPVVEPATGEVFEEVGAASVQDLEEAVAAAKKVFPAWAALTPFARGELLFRFADLVRQHSEELAVLEARNVGGNPALLRWRRRQVFWPHH